MEYDFEMKGNNPPWEPLWKCWDNITIELNVITQIVYYSKFVILAQINFKNMVRIRYTQKSMLENLDYYHFHSDLNFQF